MGGLHPVVAVYATFLNRAFDQVLMDVALHRCGVTFVLDRAGVTGDDGASHNGMWDMSMLQVVPGLRLAAPRDATRLRELLREAVLVDDAPTVVRFPKGPPNADLEAVGRVGGCRRPRPDRRQRRAARRRRRDGRHLRRGRRPAAPPRASASPSSTRAGSSRSTPPSSSSPAQHRLVVSVEDNGVVGGCGSVLLQTLNEERVDTPVRLFGIPQRFLDHAKRAAILEQIGLTPQVLARRIVEDVTALDRGENLVDVE